MENRFGNYRAPETNEVFSDQFKADLLEYKLEKIRAMVATTFKEKEFLEKVLNGTTPLTFRYNCPVFTELGLVDSSEEGLSRLCRAVANGFSNALDQYENDQDIVKLYVSGELDEDQPFLATVSLRVINDEEN